MTPKEKAQSLVNQFYHLTASLDNSQAKKSAIICVEEILAYIDRINNAKFGIIQTLSKSDWQQVLTEIEKL